MLGLSVQLLSVLPGFLRRSPLLVLVHFGFSDRLITILHLLLSKNLHPAAGFLGLSLLAHWSREFESVFELVAGAPGAISFPNTLLSPLR